MSKLFSARQVCEQALRRIGAYSPNDDAADGVDLAIALDALDLAMSELAGTEQLWWLSEATEAIALTAAVASYDLTDILDIDMQFPFYAQLDTGNNNRTPVRIVTRREFEDLSDPTSSGDPDIIHIDRLAAPTMRVYPVPALAGRTIRLTSQKFLPNVADEVGGNIAHGLVAAWQRWATYQLAIDLGSGPIRRLQQSDQRLNISLAEDAKARLLGFHSREHSNDAPISCSSDLV